MMELSLRGGSIRDFQIICKLGEGSFSSVYKVKRFSDNQEYAMKKVKMGQLKEKEKENSLNEVRILASIDEEHIVSYKEAFFEDSTMTLCVVMEFAGGGDLQKVINDHIKNKTFFKEQEIWQALVHMTRGLKVLHDMKILHRDLKCANIFIMKKDNIFKLGDLNVSKVAKMGLVYTQTGTPYYASPEVWRDQPYDAKSDIWSLGCILYEMTSLKPPFTAPNMDGLYKKVQKGVYDKIPSRYSKDLSTIISQLLQVNPADRPNCTTILTSPIVTKSHENTKQRPSSCKNKQQQNLLQTIKLPKNLNQLKGKLPKANYAERVQITEEEDQEQNYRSAPRSAQVQKRAVSDDMANLDAIKIPTAGTPQINSKAQQLIQEHENLLDRYQQINKYVPSNYNDRTNIFQPVLDKRNNVYQNPVQHEPVKTEPAKLEIVKSNIAPIKQNEPIKRPQQKQNYDYQLEKEKIEQRYQQNLPIENKQNDYQKILKQKVSYDYQQEKEKIEQKYQYLYEKNKQLNQDNKQRPISAQYELKKEALKIPINQPFQSPQHNELYRRYNENLLQQQKIENLKIKQMHVLGNYHSPIIDKYSQNIDKKLETPIVEKKSNNRIQSAITPSAITPSAVKASDIKPSAVTPQQYLYGNNVNYQNAPSPSYIKKQDAPSYIPKNKDLYSPNMNIGPKYVHPLYNVYSNNNKLMNNDVILNKNIGHVPIIQPQQKYQPNRPNWWG